MTTWTERPIPTVSDVATQQKRSRSVHHLVYGFLLLVTGVVAYGTVSAMSPSFWLTWTLLAIGAVAIVSRPILGIYLMVPLALLADNALLPWYPFVKNLSSRESVSFIDDGLSLSPLELYLLLTLATWVVSCIAEPRRIRGGELGGPIAAFTGFVLFGLMHGLATGGDRYAALWEVRSLFYLPLIYLLATNLFTRREHFERLFWLIMSALAVEGVVGLHRYLTLSEAEAEWFEGRSLVEHSAALHMNTVFVLIAAAWMFRGSSAAKRVLLPVMAIPVLIVYINSERRSAFVALILAGVIMAVVLAWYNRRAFLLSVPLVAVVFGVYLGAFWNDESAVGFPAQSVKTVLAPDQLSEQNRSSDDYRRIETHNLVETVRSAPVTGLGFGQRFHRPLPLPDISWFPFWEYLPHNSILWLWIKVGVGGLLAFLYLSASVISRGLSIIKRSESGDEAALVLTSALLYVMFLVFAYVDIAWDAQTALYLGVAAALIANVERFGGEQAERHATEETPDLAGAVTAAPG
jgi:hypothetical protein